ncbi:MAG: DUF2911 domain-containing protein [Terriglobales bacterium]
MKLTAAFALLLAAPLALAQGNKPPASPPEQATLQIPAGTVQIKYSSPSVRGRQIFGPGGLLSHDGTYPAWRAGANAATSLHTDADLRIGSLSVPKGDYTLFVFVQDPDHWQLIVNKQTGQWGLTYDAKRDLGRVPMEMSVPDATVEHLRWVITGHSLSLQWDKHIGTVALSVK